MDTHAKNILIVKLGAIGDVVNSLPFVNRLRASHPDARITWLIGPLAHQLVAGHRAVDEFLVFDARRARDWPRMVRALRARRFDLAIDLQRILKSGLVTRLSGAPLRLGFDRARCKEGAHLFTNRRIPPHPSPGTTVDQYLEFADHLGCAPAALAWDVPWVPGPTPLGGERRVVLHVGATKSANRWPPASWARLARRLVELEGVTIHLVGGADDRDLTRAVIAAADLGATRIVDHAGRLSLPASAGLVREARIFVGGDSGLLHVAVGLGIPVVALFGAADPRRTGPHGMLEHVVVHPTPCSPCRRRACNVAGHPCMTGLDPEVVVARVRARLAEPARAS